MFTVRVANSLTGAQNFRGSFSSEDIARAYRDEQADRSRRFVSFEIWLGTSKNPIKPVAGSLVQGTK